MRHPARSPRPPRRAVVGRRSVPGRGGAFPSCVNSLAGLLTARVRPRPVPGEGRRQPCEGAGAPHSPAQSGPCGRPGAGGLRGGADGCHRCPGPQAKGSKRGGGETRSPCWSHGFSGEGSSLGTAGAWGPLAYPRVSLHPGQPPSFKVVIPSLPPPSHRKT